MLIGKLIKPCKIVIYEAKEDGGEIESFTLLKLNLVEVYKLLESATEKELTLDNSIVIKYSGNDATHQLWKELATEHCQSKPEEFIDVSAKFKSAIAGTSALVRDSKNHIIRIIKRDGDDNMTINRICIDNLTREKFFYDSKLSTMFKTAKKYAIDTQDLELYNYWSKYMNMSFINQLKEYKKNK